MKIAVYCAHDDDALFAIGGLLSRYTKEGNELFYVIFTDGRRSHKAVLGIDNNPNEEEVKSARRQEITKALKLLNIKNIYFLDFFDGGLENKEDEAYRKCLQLTLDIKPDTVFYLFQDAHRDHKASNRIVERILDNLPYAPKKFRYVVWTKDLAKNRTEVNPEKVPELPKSTTIVKLSTEELGAKKKAIAEMRSQILTNPYPEWQAQNKPILDKNFVNYFLRGEEILIKRTEC